MMFVVMGDAPKMPKLAVTKDAAVCANPKNPALLEEKFVVEKTAAFGMSSCTSWPIKVSRSMSPMKKKSRQVQLDNKNCRFEPHVVLVRTGQNSS